MSAGQQVDEALTIVQRTAGILIDMVGPTPKILSKVKLAKALMNLEMAATMIKGVLDSAANAKHESHIQRGQ